MESSKIKYSAARSVHLGYETGGPVDLFYNEVTVEQTTPGSYFMVCGWSCGYFGIQQLTSNPDDNVVLFSAWDSTTGDDPDGVPLKDRVSVEDVGEDVKVDRFGGEGTGAKLMAPLPWKVEQTVACFVTAQLENDLSCYTGWVKHPETGNWWRLGTLKTRAGGVLLQGLYSFVEDFRRDVVSAGENRRALFGNGWVRAAETGLWRPLSSATFTASNAEWEAKETIDAGQCSKGFYLSTGGDVCSSKDIGCLLVSSQIWCKPPTLPQL